MLRSDSAKRSASFSSRPACATIRILKGICLDLLLMSESARFSTIFAGFPLAAFEFLPAFAVFSRFAKVLGDFLPNLVTSVRFFAASFFGASGGGAAAPLAFAARLARLAAFLARRAAF
ncbi:hypothetical protein [Paracoccus sp. S1E-3]|uniref:hypothetical protein n=1 Tax=Paracoccus sp. S1E-3 TaxID=2756130 RepID=UPI0015EE859E|nr:hypothetical protein [Paracoccus sp. S1E-3]MBA4490503.1 hypothetical protein [Paracoccus sp. S1E-3]